MTEFRNIPAFLERELRSQIETQQHWSSASQTYAPADALMQCLTDGWTLSPIVAQQAHRLGGRRHVNVYHFELSNGHQQVVMQVLDNPVVRRLVRERSLKIVRISGNDSTQQGKSIDA